MTFPGWQCNVSTSILDRLAIAVESVVSLSLSLSIINKPEFLFRDIYAQLGKGYTNAPATSETDCVVFFFSSNFLRNEDEKFILFCLETAIADGDPVKREIVTGHHILCIYPYNNYS